MAAGGRGECLSAATADPPEGPAAQRRKEEVMEHTSGEKIVEALKLLEEAAKQKKDELKSVMSDKYTHLRDVIVETEQSLGKSLSAAGKQAVQMTTHAKDAGVDRVVELAGEVDKQVHGNPWPYIAGTAGVAVLVGFMLGHNRK